MSRFTIEEIQSAHKVIDPVFLHTPQYECETLGNYFRNQVVLKIETINPIRSFKGRGADLLVAGSDQQELICASAGNFGQAMAYACRKKNIRLSVVVSEAANAFKVDRMKSLGATVISKGYDFDEAKMEARDIAAQSGIRFVEDSLDADTIIGAGTIGLELSAFASQLDFLLVPLGNGALINGIAKVFKAYGHSTKIIAVQSIGASAMIESWRLGEVIIHETINTVAEGIGVRIPVPEALHDMHGLVDEGLLVKETSIFNAMELIRHHTGLIVEPSAAVGIAALLENREFFEQRSVGTVLTGSNLTAEQMRKWFRN